MSSEPPIDSRADASPERRLIDAAFEQELSLPAEPSPVSGDASSPCAFADRISGYEIAGEIHRGGQGVVYLAVQEGTKRKVAIKVMREGPFAGPRDKARFDREVEVLGQLNHPNIVAIHNSGSVGGMFYFVMDYISGQPLDVWMASGKRSIEETLKLFAKICEAVNAAHLKGVIHRDLKPGNIRIDSQGEPHVLDFGLAKMAAGTEASVMTVTGQFIGSLPWSSPEQAEGIPGRIDTRTDVYSLGVIVYQMLTGRFPYEVVGNIRDVLDRIIKTEPAKPSTIRRQINDEVETIVLKCLSKERERRYQSAGELARDIGHYLAGDPIEAKRDSALYVLRKQLRRHLGPVLVGVSFVVMLVFSCALAWMMYAQQRQMSWREQKVAEDRQKSLARTQADLHRVLLERAAAVRVARRPGYRREVWASLHEAAALDIPDRNMGEIQEQILSCLSDFVGLDPLDSPEVDRVQHRLPSAVFRSIIAEHRQSDRFVWALSPNERFLAGASWLSAVRGAPISIWDDDGVKSATTASPVSYVQDMEFTPDNQFLVVGGGEGWAAFQMPDLSRYGFVRGDKIDSVAVHPMGRMLATSGNSPMVELWSLTSNRLLAQLESSLPEGGRNIEFSADGTVLLALDGGGAIRRAWSVGGTPERRIFGGHQGGITGLSFSPDGAYLASASKDMTVKIWNTVSGRLEGTCEGHRAAIQSLSFSPEAPFLVSGDWAGDVRLWNAHTAQFVQALDQPKFLAQVWRVRFSPSGRYLAVGGSNGLAIWRIEHTSGVLRASIVSSHEGLAVRDVAIHPAEHEFVFAVDEGRLYRATLEDQPVPLSVPLTVRFPVYSLHFTYDGHWLRFVGQDNSIATYDWCSSSQIAATTEKFDQCLTAVSGQGRWLAARRPANRLLVYDLAADRVLFSLPPENTNIWSLEWSSDATALAEGRSNGELAVWNLEAVRQRLAEFRIAVASTIQELPVPMPIAMPSEQQPHAQFPSEQTFENTHPAN